MDFYYGRRLFSSVLTHTIRQNKTTQIRCGSNVHCILINIFLYYFLYFSLLLKKLNCWKKNLSNTMGFLSFCFHFYHQRCHFGFSKHQSNFNSRALENKDSLLTTNSENFIFHFHTYLSITSHLLILSRIYY